jgi:hypothetical protein
MFRLRGFQQLEGLGGAGFSGGELSNLKRKFQHG